MHRQLVAWCAIACLPSAAAWAQAAPLTLADALARAREHAPQVAVARLAAEESRGRLIGASRRFQSNPDVDFSIGRRQDRETSQGVLDVQVGVAQTFEPGTRKRARLAGAEAANEQGAAARDETTREVLAATAEAFYRVLHADQRVRLLREAEALAATVAATADRRFAAGDIAVLDVNLSRTSLARVRADLAGTEALRAHAEGDLRQLLGVEEPVTVTGSLSEALGEPNLDALLAATATRPDLRELDAAAREAAAERQLGLSMTRPAWGLGARFSREERDKVVLGTFTIALPTFATGQDLIAAGGARAARFTAAADAARRRVRTEVSVHHAAYLRRVAAVRELEAAALPNIDDSLALAARSYDVGQIGLPDLLVLRRELFDARLQHLDALLEAALARVGLDASAGVLR